MQDAGCDVGDPHLMATRSWRWGSARITGLMSRPPVGFVRIQVDKSHYRMQPLYGTRVQTHFFDSAG